MSSEQIPQMVTEHGAAQILRNEVQTLRNYRHLRKGPPYIKIGRNVVVGAGAVVTKNIDNNLIVTGVPAKVADRYQDLHSFVLLCSNIC